MLMAGDDNLLQEFKDRAKKNAGNRQRQDPFLTLVNEDVHSGTSLRELKELKNHSGVAVCKLPLSCQRYA